ncbi:MAG: phosphodiester glycosidase family protein [bacterium]|nr:phosphodiester glycosidase family protein [bacterium]
MRKAWIITALFSLLVGAWAPSVSAAWEELAPGLELGLFAVENPGGSGDARIEILRIDPGLWDLELLCRSAGQGRGELSAKGWCEIHDLKAAINAGMFDLDHETHVGYLQAGEHVNSKRVNRYESVAAFDPIDNSELPPFRIFDLDDPAVSLSGIREDYGTVIQNLRLIKRPGENRWSRQDRRWSEAALGEDTAGRALFIFCRRPFSMHDFNELLLGLDIDLVAAQHLEGGPQAQLHLRHESVVAADMVGDSPWPIPFVLGIRPYSGAMK